MQSGVARRELHPSAADKEALWEASLYPRSWMRSSDSLLDGIRWIQAALGKTSSSWKSPMGKASGPWNTCMGKTSGPWKLDAVFSLIIAKNRAFRYVLEIHLSTPCCRSRFSPAAGNETAHVFPPLKSCKMKRTVKPEFYRSFLWQALTKKIFLRKRA